VNVLLAIETMIPDTTVGKPATVITDESLFLMWASSCASTASSSSSSSVFTSPVVTQMTDLLPVPAESALASSLGITAIGGVDRSACVASRSTISYSVGYFSRSMATAWVAR